MKTTTLVLTVLFISIMNLTPAQVLSTQQSFQDIHMTIVRDETLKKNKSIEGSQYITEKFNAVRIEGYGEKLYNARFNAYTGNIEVQLPNRVISLNTDKSLSVEFVNSNKKYKNYNNEKNSKSTFYVVLNETDNYSLLKLESVRLREAQKAKNSYSKSKPAMFVRKSDAYFIKKGNTIQEIELKKKSLLALSEKNSKAIKDFLKKENINLKNEVDLTKAIDFVMKL